MSCDEARLLDYLDGELDGDERREVELHVERCRDCRTLIRRQQIADEAVSNAMAEVPPLSAAEVRDLVAETMQQRRPVRGRVIRLVPRIALVAAAAAVALALTVRPGHDSTPGVDAVAVDTAEPRRVEMRLATGDPSIQVVWIMDSELEL